MKMVCICKPRDQIYENWRDQRRIKKYKQSDYQNEAFSESVSYLWDRNAYA